MNFGGLFSEYFLTEGIKGTAVWSSVGAGALGAVRNELTALYQSFRKIRDPNESQTERDLVDPALRALDWPAFSTQLKASRKGRTDVPDYLLFADEAAKNIGLGENHDADAYKHGLTILEAKAWNVPLDRGTGALGEGVPSNQILRYLNLVEVQSENRIRWGILTNGRVWRLYWQGARSRAEDFLELNLAAILGLEPDLFAPDEAARDHWLRVFILLFGRSAFIANTSGKTFHQIALEENRLWEERVTTGLSEVVFKTVFPALATGLAAADQHAPAPLTDAYLAELREATLTYLYRLLFVLYAEDRNLLPTRHPKYDDYGLHPKRDEIARRLDARDTFSDRRTDLDNHLRGLWRSIDEGDTSIGLPPYNGGLFKPGRSAILERASLPDAVFAPILDALSRRDDEHSRRVRINYRDLNVQHLGSIYERLLEFDLLPDGASLRVRPQIFARKGSGSYYTPEELVMLVIRKTLRPLLDERRETFRAKSAALQSDRRPVSARLAELQAFDPASAFLDLKICDPAMGSGHFLVSLVDYLGDEVLGAIADAPAIVDWADYQSPLLARLADIRARIKAQAVEHGWQVADEQLEDKQLVRRMILKRVIYGVDKNPMAVELAKLSLWLHTFTVGAPLSFLDHHLRAGDSLFGETVRGVMDTLHQRGGLLINSFLQSAKAAAKGMDRIEQITDADIAEVRESTTQFDDVEKKTAPLARLFSLLHAFEWLKESDHEDGIDAKRKTKEKHKPADRNQASIDQYLDGQFGDLFDIVLGVAVPIKPHKNIAGTTKQKITRLEAYDLVCTLLQKARDLAASENFFHWQIAFPGVWSNWESMTPSGGFDAIIGNPPWDRVKLQDVEWFAARDPAIAHAQRAADRKKLIENLKKDGNPLWRDYIEAAARAEAAARMARTSGRYPLLSGGDVNLYSLFVEQAHHLVKPEGLVGLIVPSGIAADKGASEFFKSITTTGRLNNLYDFENRRGPGRSDFFPDVDSRFKFCAFIAGGKKRAFTSSECAFFLRETTDADIANHSFQMSAADFAAVNPNTGTAPIFRSQRDAELTTAIYRRVPVLVDRRNGGEVKTWPVKYMRMFDMTNDSGLFKTRAELEAGGFYPVAGNRLKKGSEEFVPLYVGRMIHQFDHRAASVAVNEDNLHNAAVSGEVTPDQKANPDFNPEPQFFIPEKELKWESKLNWAIGFRDIARSTDMRTIIGSIVPKYGFGNKLPLLIPENDATYSTFAPLLLSNMNAFVFDFISRQKIHSTSVNFYLFEQLPVLPASAYVQKFGSMTAADIVKREVLRLTYTAHDMEPFARDMGYDGPPFIWDETDRRHRRARLDALYFHLYGISREDADYILSTFPIVEKQDRAEFGRYLTRDLILAYMNALDAGDSETVVALR
jgi:hypothetical protein